MHYIFLWNHPLLRQLSASERFRRIHHAIVLFNEEKSTDFYGRYAVILILAILPAVIIFINFSFLFAFAMFWLNIAVLEAFMAKSEVPFIAKCLEDER
ncbi:MULTISPECIES: hypothetical protein [Thalassotalea]|uniref:hypothetical protein n=1 Tax=Thalassotalea TaxID=1518149 RepID=UPI000943914E|nr:MULTISPECIES: hypothetical protein [Thalassotalea]MDO6427538.1 hypothetical protein [Thalassotalea sp. 1_MG-2023]OKY25676.1 hypothetical protein BI291_15230 [Thalassotalea sp. PP2-459]